MKDRKLLGIGIGGAALTALCCFTPLPVLVLGALGVVAWVGWLDIALLPLLILFLALAAYAARRLHARRCRP